MNQVLEGQHSFLGDPAAAAAAAAVTSVVSDSVRLHGLQPSELPCPWDSPGKVLEWVATAFSLGDPSPSLMKQQNSLPWPVWEDVYNPRNSSDIPGREHQGESGLRTQPLTS